MLIFELFHFTLTFIVQAGFVKSGVELYDTTSIVWAMYIKKNGNDGDAKFLKESLPK